jgi:hypothetical protein
MILTKSQMGVLRHALGTGEDGRKRSYRNHFVTGPGSDDFNDCVALVDGGLMTRRAGTALSGWDDVFTVTEAGRQAARNRSRVHDA